MKNKINLYFTRHGEHNNDESKTDMDQDLTEWGIQEAQNLSTKIESNKNMIAFTSNNTRSVQTAMLIQNIQHSSNKVKTEDKYLYGVSKNEMFNKEIYSAYKSKKILRYLYEESDKFEDNDVVNFSKMVIEISKILIKYDKIDKNLDSRNLDIEINRLFVLKEYFYPAFRLKVLELKYGKDYAKTYLEWYEQNLEFKDLDRQNVNKITIENREIFMSDSYGVERIPNEIIEALLNKEKVEIIYRSYAIIHNNTNAIMAKYKDNEYGFIGGGLEEGEDFRQSLLRELTEEIGFKNDQINEIHEVKENYMYMSKINVDKQKLENEFSKNLNIFKFYIIEAENLDKIKSNELEKFDIEMIDLDSLFSEKYIPFPDIIRILKPNFVV